MYEENDGVIVESSATEEVVENTENTDAVTEETPAVSTEEGAPKEAAVIEEESAPSKKDAQARIRQLVEERDRIRTARDESERRAAYLEGQLEGKKVDAPVKQEADAQPRAEQFEVYDDYVRAVGRWEARQEFNRLDAEREQKVKERETKTREEQVETTFKDKVAEFKAKTPDFDDVMGNPSLRISKTMYEAMRESDAGAQIAYHLGKNPAEAARISALSPIAAIREIGKLEAKFDKPPAQAVNNVTKAPPPPSTVDGTSGGAGKDPSKMTDAEWYSAWKAEQVAKIKAVRK